MNEIASGGNDRSRDIDLVMVTGAGASREFGVNGTKLPLMGDWSDALVKKLSQRGQYLEATGLQRGMGGEAFETQLGRFLHQVEAFGQIGDLLEPAARFQDFGPATQFLMSKGGFDQYYRNANFHFGQIIDLIHESLYELFSGESTDTGGAASAYGALLQSLAVGPDDRFVYATTNYDTLGEQSIRASGRYPDWGQPPSLGNEGEIPLAVPGLLGGIDRYVPVLHLHGRVGWYRREGRVYATTNTKYQAGFGIPITMLPDPDKIYDQDDVVNSLWQQFTEALTRAKRIFVLGHSLNDGYLVRALKENVYPFDRIAVTVLKIGDDDRDLHESAEPILAKISENIAGASIIPMRFGVKGRDTSHNAIRAWREKLDTDGLL
jgi:hypothetical protein